MDRYRNLAKKAIMAYFATGETITPPANLPPEFFSEKAGVFVTIYNKKNLRGCIGTYLPTRKNVAEEIIFNAIVAATQDHRFSPITLEELTQLSFETSILTTPEKIKFKEELDPKKYGILVRFNHHSGLLLPNLAGIDTIEKQIDIACREKAGIDPDNPELEIYKFEVKRH